MFQLYRGYATSDRANIKNGAGQLTRDLAQNLACAVNNTSFGQSLAGTVRGQRGDMFRVRAMQAAKGKYPQLRQSVSEYVVSYDQLSPTLQRLNKRGSRVMTVSPA